ncbi:MAG: hypothetical protein BWY96_02505 [Spirochaetes bacterium ADurb.BinA120]|nr:MAG: hypothetical protein BWY96_02505 [Spirochaetes bacterium ADurb.BinA120]
MVFPRSTRAFSPPERTRMGFRASSPSNSMEPQMFRAVCLSDEARPEAISSSTLKVGRRLVVFVCA